MSNVKVGDRYAVMSYDDVYDLAEVIELNPDGDDYLVRVEYIDLDGTRTVGDTPYDSLEPVELYYEEQRELANPKPVVATAQVTGDEFVDLVNVQVGLRYCFNPIGVVYRITAIRGDHYDFESESDPNDRGTITDVDVLYDAMVVH